MLEQLQRLLDRGVKQFKFVDRTFNLNVAVSKTILEFFLARHQPGHFFHFEMIPDRLPESLREIIARFPPGALQFEVGIQTFNEEVGRLIQRRQNYEQLADNFHFLRARNRRPYPRGFDCRAARGNRGKFCRRVRPAHRARSRRKSRWAF